MGPPKGQGQHRPALNPLPQLPVLDPRASSGYSRFQSPSTFQVEPVHLTLVHHSQLAAGLCGTTQNQNKCTSGKASYAKTLPTECQTYTQIPATRSSQCPRDSPMHKGGRGTERSCDLPKVTQRQEQS